MSKQQEDAIAEDLAGQQVLHAAKHGPIMKCLAEINRARIPLEHARRTLAYEIPVTVKDVPEVITLVALAQVAVQKALDAARKLEGP